MTPLLPPLGRGELVFWRLDKATFASSWDSGEGAFLFGGRWNSRNRRVVYASLDPATAILEVAVHIGFAALDAVAHELTSATIANPVDVHVVQASDVPNRDWMTPGIPRAEQQAFGDGLLAAHSFVLIPSVVSSHSWNLIFDAPAAAGAYALRPQERFVLDARLRTRAR